MRFGKRFGTRVPLWIPSLALLAGPLAISGQEAWSWLHLSPEQRAADLVPFLVATTPYLVWFFVLPVLMFRGKSFDDRDHPWNEAPSSLGPFLCFSASFALGMGISAFLGWRVRNLPPLYHDEYSYIFQSWTFLAGRLWFPSPSLAAYFDQMHVLNDGVFVGRYFPGASLFYAPFVAMDFPILGGWFAHGLVAGFIGMAAYRTSAGAGYLAGGMVASSPALVAFSNLLLSPHPTMVGFAIFLWAYPRTCQRSLLWPCIAGLAIGFAFLCRPLTAVGLGFPYAVHAIWLTWRRRRSSRVTMLPEHVSRSPVVGIAGNETVDSGGSRLDSSHFNGEDSFSMPNFAVLVASFAVAIVLLLGYNASITGSPFESPYGRYLARHTPSHVYGFHNRDRGLAARGPHTLVAYDDWAENLTPTRAITLTKERWERLFSWGLGIVPTVTLGVLALGLLIQGRREIVLPLSSVAGLTAAYFPYAFAGVLGFSYLVELLPPMFLAFAIAVGSIANDWRSRGWTRAGTWWLAFPLIAILTNVLVRDPLLFDPDSELVYPRRLAAERERLEQTACLAGPILVLFDADPKDAVHTTYVFNRPDLRGPVVRAWLHPPAAGKGSLPSHEKLMEQFPERAVYLYRPTRGSEPPVWTRLRGPIKSR